MSYRLVVVQTHIYAVLFQVFCVLLCLQSPWALGRGLPELHRGHLRPGQRLALLLPLHPRRDVTESARACSYYSGSIYCDSNLTLLAVQIWL